MTNLTADDRRPVLDKEGKYWVLKVWGAGPVRISVADNALANAVWQAATQAYHNGSADRCDEIRQALGVS